MFDTKKIRNFGIIAHIDAGKTTTTERILYHTGATYKIGEVDEGTTVTDWMQEERERGITIVSACVSCSWKDAVYHLIDTPGHVDFTAEVQRSLKVLDGALVVFCGVSGVQTQSETVWKQADANKIPRIVFINKLDRTGANFENVLSDITNKLKTTPLPITIPFYENDSFKGIIDLTTMKLITFDEKGKIKSEEEIPESHARAAAQHKENLINILTSFDDALLEKYVEKNELTKEELINSIRSGTLQRKFVPVFSGSSLKNIGIPNLLDSINLYLPSPDDINSTKAYFYKNDSWENLPYDQTGFPVAFIFKLQYHREKGVLAFVRIYSGKIKNGDTLFNPRTKKRERIQDLMKVFADKYERVEESFAGDIAAITGLKNIITGDTLCNESHQVALEVLKFPEPVIFLKVEAKNTIDKDKFNIAKDHLLLEDPTITCVEDKETGQTLIGGMGELHIQIFLDRIKKEYYIDLKSGAPQVAHKETPKKAGRLEYSFDNKIEGNIQHVIITLSIEPLEKNSGILIENNIKKIDKEILKSIEKGISQSLKAGPEQAYPVIDCRVIIENADYDNTKTTPLAFEAASSLCTTYLLRETGALLLEPIMKLELDVPSNYTGTVIGDLQSRSGVILDVVQKMNQDIITAKAPLKVMFGYTTNLRSITQGKASFSMEFLEYDRSN